MLSRQHFAYFDASQLSEIWEQIVKYSGWIASVLGVIAFVGWVAGFRPRAHRVSQRSFIDYQSDRIYEEIEFNISWGHVFFLRKIKLPRIEREASFKVLCKPLGEIRDVLHMDNFEEKTSHFSRVIYLVNKDFFKNNEIEDIFLEITRAPPPDYHDKIEIRRSSEKIEILNWNYIEVRGFPVGLPKEITLDKILAYSSYFSEWITPSESDESITAVLKPLPPCMGESPGKVTIPLN